MSDPIQMPYQNYLKKKNYSNPPKIQMCIPIAKCTAKAALLKVSDQICKL